MYEAIIYLLGVRVGELKKKQSKQFKANDTRNLDKIEMEVKRIEKMIKILEMQGSLIL